jgi:hypothetical protein
MYAMMHSTICARKHYKGFPVGKDRLDVLSMNSLPDFGESDFYWKWLGSAHKVAKSTPSSNSRINRPPGLEGRPAGIRKCLY